MKQLLRKTVLAALLLGCASIGLAQEDGEGTIFKDAFLDKLVGEWQLTGVVAGDSVENTLEAKWVLNHQFLQLHYRDVNVPSQYEALVYIGFNHAKQRYVVHWLDVFGGGYSETLGFGRRDKQSVTFVFESPEGLLHNTFQWLPEQKGWRLVIKQQDKSGAWQVFAVQEMRKREEEMQEK